MLPSDIALIRRQFATVKGQEAAFGAAFYARLFQDAPRLRVLFPPDLADQSRKLMMTLGFAVASLDRVEALRPVVVELGCRHVAYGVDAGMLAPVGHALLATLADTFGPGFDTDARAAWLSAYSTLAAMMAEGLDAARNRVA
ncbi:globin domain-containing protein [Paracoccus sp. CPCC 101403]|uniref:Globin domain-containing protein n=1 Tax=Paracoccus broussonetiae TaxID=3075834 RepID=A0ABU3EDP7_9RHOB|nr:globin domain-containing protein [Paracoccus sp. CPCC 101403]MDT1062352.1 globin domain-containing protein [Paracoccus sp. CPCC 101403]